MKRLQFTLSGTWGKERILKDSLESGQCYLDGCHIQGEKAATLTWSTRFWNSSWWIFASFCSKENILGDSKTLMRDVSLPSLKSSLLMGDVLQALGDRRRWLGCMIHWSGHSDSEHENTGRHTETTPSPPPPSPPRVRHADEGEVLIEEHDNDVCHRRWFRLSEEEDEGRDRPRVQWSRRMAERGGHVGGGRDSVDEDARWEAADHFTCSLSPTKGTLYR